MDVPAARSAIIEMEGASNIPFAALLSASVSTMNPAVGSIPNPSAIRKSSVA